MKQAIILLFVLCVSACAVPSVQYYQLPDSTFRQPKNTISSQALRISVERGDMLRGDALIYQNSPQTVHFARQHVWAENLEQAAANVMANTLNEISLGQVYVPDTFQAACPCVKVFLQRFNGSFDGMVRVAGFAQKIDKNGKIIGTQSFAVSRKQQGDGYAAMVTALNEALKDAARQIMQ